MPLVAGGKPAADHAQENFRVSGNVGVSVGTGYRAFSASLPLPTGAKQAITDYHAISFIEVVQVEYRLVQSTPVLFLSGLLLEPMRYSQQPLSSFRLE